MEVKNRIVQPSVFITVIFITKAFQVVSAKLFAFECLINNFDGLYLI